MNEPLFGHPEIVIHFGEILVARVRNDSDDAFRFCLLAAITQGASEKRAGGGTAEDSFLTQKLAHRRETLLIINLKGFCH